MTASQQLDGNYRQVTGSASLYDPVSASFVAQRAGLTSTGTDGTVNAPTLAALTITPPLIVQKAQAVSTGSVASSTGTGTGTTASTSALAASTPNSIAFLGVAVGTAVQAVSVTSGTTWTLDSTQNSGGTAAGLFTFGSLSQSLPATIPVVPKATIAGSEPWAAAAAVFKPAMIGIQGTVTLAGYNYTHITTDATTLVKTGPGILHSIIINTHGASATIEFDDALTHTSPVMGIITCPGTITSAIPIALEYDVQFSTGLSVTTGTATLDATIVWK